MRITVEGPLLYIYLAQQGQYKYKETLSDLDGHLIYDDEGNWMGVRFPLKEGLEFVQHQFIERKTANYCDLLFTTEAEPSHYYDQEVIVDVAKEGITGIEIIRYPSIPEGKLRWIESIVKVNG